MTFAIDTAEKIETLVLCYLKNQTTEGAFGTISPLGNGWYGVHADGVFARVIRGPSRWHVTIPAKQVIGADSDLLTAAQFAMEA